MTNAGDNTVRTSSGMSSLPGNASMLGWATSSLSVEGKPSEHTSHLPASSSAPNISYVVNASSGSCDSGSPRMEKLFVIEEIKFPESPSLPESPLRSDSSPSLPESPLRSDSFLYFSDYEDSSCLPTSGRKVADDLTKPVKPFSQEKEEQGRSKEKQDEDEDEDEDENEYDPFFPMLIMRNTSNQRYYGIGNLFVDP